MMTTGLVATGLILLFSSISFAIEGKDQAQIKTLKAAAESLQKSNPGLAAGLTKFANQEAAEKDEKNEEKNETEGVKEEGMKKEHADHNIKLLRDSAAALNQSDPALAQNLLEMADRSEKKMMSKGMEEKNEKEDKDTDGKQ
jgi:hypothetical protein